jgi:hypothetical protein
MLNVSLKIKFSFVTTIPLWPQNRDFPKLNQIHLKRNAELSLKVQCWAFQRSETVLSLSLSILFQCQDQPWKHFAGGMIPHILTFVYFVIRVFLGIRSHEIRTKGQNLLTSKLLEKLCAL